MAGSKRNRQSLRDDSDDSFDSDDDQNGASMSKRARTLSPNSSEQGGEDQRSHSRNGQPSPPTSDDGEDEGGDDSSSDDEGVQRATQKRLNRQRDIVNRPADYGVIESVTCFNFMCHVHLSVTLGPLINFIIGHNGSGKSAVLTAITLCLGGKAATTNRGQALRNFIRTGAESSTIAVKLKNGPGGYQTEVYGESIIVERNFSIAGASGFKLKSANGRIISTKKGELDQICDYFALQIDNPMNVLSQDMARQFLNNSSPADKYRFFIRGIQLEQLDNDYQLIEDSIAMMEPQLDTAKEDINALEEQMKAAKHRLSIAERSENLEPRIQELSNQMAWAQVEEQEASLSKLESEVAQADREASKHERRLADVSKTFDEADEASRVGQEAVEAAEADVVPIETDRQEIKERAGLNKGELHDNQAQSRGIRNQMRAVQGRMARQQQEIAQEQDRLKALDGGKLESMLAKIEDAKAQIERLNEEQIEHDSRTPGLHSGRKPLQDEYDRATGAVNGRKSELQKVRESIRSLERDRNDSLQAFGPDMDKLLRAIQNERGFRERPVGPVGQHIVLKNPVWLNVVDKSLGAVLSSFIVTSKADQTLLQGIMQRGRHNFQILIGNRTQIDVRQHEPDPAYETTLRILEIDNELVRNQLIINQAIEQTLLIESMDEGMNLMSATPPPRNVKQCFCLNHNRRGWGHRIGLRGGQEVGTSPVEPIRGRARFKMDIQSQINIEKNNERALMDDLLAAEQKVTDLRRQLERMDRDIRQHVDEESTLRRALQRASQLKARSEDERDQSTTDNGRLAGLETLLEESKAEFEIQENAYGAAVNNKDRLNDLAAGLKVEVDAVDERLRGAETELMRARKGYDQAFTARTKALQAKNRAVLDANEVRNKIRALADRVEDQRNTIEQYKGEAGKICLRVRIPPGETSESLDAKIVALDQEMQRFISECGASKPELARDALKKTTAYDEAYREHGYTVKMKNLWKTTLESRRLRWLKFRAIISTSARSAFGAFLQERGYKGQLILRHRQKELELFVEPDETQAGRGRGTKTLSGGEKSFSTISFLLALWDAMGSPIRCLDEFDVFMDNVNRDVAMNMMINAARLAAGKQYILITPNSMGSLQIADDMKIIKLTDPERGQTSLPFVPVAA